MWAPDVSESELIPCAIVPFLPVLCQAFNSVTDDRRWNWETYQFVSAAEAIFSRWIREQERKTRELQHQQLAAMSQRPSRLTKTRAAR